jgi:ABC-type lipoprotein export system ATPase subunit
LDFLEKMHKQGKTIVMVTHDPIIAQKYAEKVYWLKDGKVEKVTSKRKQ